MSTPVIQVEGLGKRYRLGVGVAQAQSRAGGLWRTLTTPFHYLIRSFSRASEAETLWALKDVSFEVQPGEVVGIIGRNGAGKTTLLKILSRITDPSQGRAVLNGRVGSLLEVGTGFHPELTGRENVFLNGAIMGLKRAEIKAKFEQIVEFAEVGKFIDTPVKRYSSGMYVRLAFAVAAHLEPEILLVDEVLAVGDLAFQKKCLGKMGSVAQEGRTVLLVSHNMEAVLGLCPRCLWIDQGGKRADGLSRQVVKDYTASCLEVACQEGLEGREREGTGVIGLKGFTVRDEQGRPSPFVLCGDAVEFVIDFATQDGREISNVMAWMWLRDHLGQPIMCLYTRLTGQDFDKIPGQGRFVCRVPRLPLAPGTYLVDIMARALGHPSDKVIGAAKLEVAPGDFYGTGRSLQGVGTVLCDHSWRLEA
ncbi:MAG: ABC transporter ATP-binding protein [Pseudomonadota bacterium]